MSKLFPTSLLPRHTPDKDCVEIYIEDGDTIVLTSAHARKFLKLLSDVVRKLPKEQS